MIPTPLAFEKVGKEVAFMQAAHLGHTELGEAPERLDTVDMILATGELVFVMMNTVMPVTIKHQAIVGAPAIRVDSAVGQHLTLDDGLQRLPRAVGHDLHVDVASSFEQAKDRNLATGSTSSPAANPPSPEVAFVDLNLAGKRPTLFHRQIRNTGTQTPMELMRGVLVHAHQLSRRQRSYISIKHLQNISKLSLGNS